MLKLRSFPYLVFSIMALGTSLTPSAAQAITFKVKPSKDRYIVKDELPLLLDTTVQRISMDLLTHHQVPFIVGDSTIESIGGYNPYARPMPDGKVRYYGWCYSVNDQVPDTLPGDTKLKQQSDRLTWFFGYAVETAPGDWLMCIPSED